MKSKKYWVLSALYFTVLVNNSLSVQEQRDWTMEFRIAANATEDATIVELAKSSDNQEIYRNGQLVSKWVKVLESVEKVLEKDPNLLTRRNEQGKQELLVLINANDVTDADVRFISADKDMKGRLALGLIFDEKGSRKIYNLTKEMCAYGHPRRYAAIIMDGKVYTAAMILSPVSGAIMITGDITMEFFEDVWQRSKLIRSYDESELPPYAYALRITPLRLIIFACVLLLVIVGSLPAKNLQKSKHPHLWTISGCIAGMLIGAYILGVSKTAGTECQVVETWQAAVGELVVINLTRVFIGGIIGIGCGFLLGRLLRFFIRRAVYNIVKAIVKMVR